MLTHVHNLQGIFPSNYVGTQAIRRLMDINEATIF